MLLQLKMREQVAETQRNLPLRLRIFEKFQYVYRPYSAHRLTVAVCWDFCLQFNFSFHVGLVDKVLRYRLAIPKVRYSG